jgi:WD40 repeat protein
MRVTIRNADNGEPETELTGLHERFDQLLASPSGNWLVARTGTKLHVWDANDWNRPPRIVAGKHKHTMRFPLAAFHPSGRYLLLADNTSSIIAFDTTTWNEARKWNWNAGSLHAVAVSSDGTLAAAGGLRGAVVVWDWDL